MVQRAQLDRKEIDQSEAAALKDAELPNLQLESISLRESAPLKVRNSKRESDVTVLSFEPTSPSDRPMMENLPGSGTFDNPYKRIAVASEAIRELHSLSTSKDDEKITIIDGDQKRREVTVAERRTELAKVAETEFGRAIIAADTINQSKVESSLFEIRGKIERAKNDEEKKALQESETALESLKHAPSAARFAFAMYLSGSGQLTKANDLLKEAGERDPEAAKDENFSKFKEEVEKAIAENRSSLINKEEFMLPLITMNLADGQRQAGDKDKAEELYKTAIRQADALDKNVIKAQLDSLAKERAQKANDPQALKELEEREMAWAAVAHAPALSRINLADFLLSQNRGAEAKELLQKVQEIDPDLVKDKKEFKEMLERADKTQTQADLNPFQHIEAFKKALEAKDIDKARSELQAAVKAADNLDRDLAQKNKKAILEQLQSEKDPEKIQQLKQIYDVYDAFDHAPAFTRVALGRFELAAKNYNVAQGLFEEAKKMDPELCARKDIEINKLIEASKQPSTFKKVLDFTKDLAKELVADAAAILAGAGAVVLTGWSGPGAIVAGGAAGAATYTGVKWLMGDEIHWYTPIWGAVDGMTGSVAALARRALVVEGGKLVSKDIAQAAVLKAGGDVTALSGLEGLKMTEAAQKIASAGLKTMGKDIGLLARLSSSIPFIGTGSAEYRSALAAYRMLSISNVGVHAMVNGGSALAGSAVYRGISEGSNYYNGQHESIEAFAKAYGRAVLKDTISGVVMGGYVDGWSNGLVMSTLVNSITVGASEPKNFKDYINKFSQKTTNDLAFGSVAWLVGLGGYTSDRYIRSGLLNTTKNAFIPSVPIWSEAFYTRESINKILGPALAELQRPPSTEELAQWYKYRTPGSERFPRGWNA